LAVFGTIRQFIVKAIVSKNHLTAHPSTGVRP
jgi:hypothetical protein